MVRIKQAIACSGSRKLVQSTCAGDLLAASGPALDNALYSQGHQKATAFSGGSHSKHVN